MLAKGAGTVLEVIDGERQVVVGSNRENCENFRRAFSVKGPIWNQGLPPGGRSTDNKSKFWALIIPQLSCYTLLHARKPGAHRHRWPACPSGLAPGARRSQGSNQTDTPKNRGCFEGSRFNYKNGGRFNFTNFNGGSTSAQRVNATCVGCPDCVSREVGAQP